MIFGLLGLGVFGTVFLICKSTKQHFHTKAYRWWGVGLFCLNIQRENKTTKKDALFHFQLKVTRLWLWETIQIKLQTLLGAIYSSPGYCRYTDTMECACAHTHTRKNKSCSISVCVNRFFCCKCWSVAHSTGRHGLNLTRQTPHVQSQRVFRYKIIIVASIVTVPACQYW